MGTGECSSVQSARNKETNPFYEKPVSARITTRRACSLSVFKVFCISCVMVSSNPDAHETISSIHNPRLWVIIPNWCKVINGVKNRSPGLDIRVRDSMSGICTPSRDAERRSTMQASFMG